MKNIDQNTVDSFGAEWTEYNQARLSEEELTELFDSYFHIFPWELIGSESEGFDMGCGSGRWATIVARKVGRLNCVDPSVKALEVAQSNLLNLRNVRFIHADASNCPLPEESQDFGYSLGVLHHIPNTTYALRKCTALLKEGAPFLLYLYYSFDNRPRWYRRIWSLSEVLRHTISRAPNATKGWITDAAAALIYYPLARLALLGDAAGLRVDNWPLSSYRTSSFYTMRTDSRDRFGTPLEQRFSKLEIEKMMQQSGLESIRFSDRTPFWCAVGIKKKQAD